MGSVIASSGSLVTTTAFQRPSMSRGVSLYNNRYQDYAVLYREQPNLRLVIRFLSRNIAQLGIKAYRRTSDTDRVPLPKTHPLVQFLKSPTPMLPIPMSQHAWVRDMVEDLALYDVLFMLKMRNAAAAELNAIRLPPPKVQVTSQNELWPDGFILTGRMGDQKTYDAPDVMYLHGHNPIHAALGMSPVESLRRILAEEAAAGEWREQYWHEAGRQTGFIQRPIDAPKWSDPARNRFESEFRASRTGLGPGAGGVPVLEDGMEFNPASFSPKDSEYLGSRKLSREETAAHYFIPPVFVGILEHANFSNIDAQHISLYADTLGPWTDWLEQEMGTQLVPEFPDVTDVYLKFNIEEKLEGSFQQQAISLQMAVGAPIMTRNEGRGKIDLPAVEGGDELVTPLNVLVGGQASPRDTAPPAVPGTASAPAGGRKRRTGGQVHYLTTWQDKHEQVLRGFFTRQRDAVLSQLGAHGDVHQAFNTDRWNTELTTDLLALSHSMTDDLGTALATEHGGTFDLARTEAWLGENARIAAEGINGATLGALADAVASVPRSGTASRKTTRHPNVTQALQDLGGLDLQDDDTPPDPIPTPTALAGPVFATALSARVLSIAASRTTSIGQWSRHEAAKQIGLQTKTWESSGAADSRHEDLDGETVGIGDTFSNGGQWPGDPALGVDETAGCLCSLTFGT